MKYFISNIKSNFQLLILLIIGIPNLIAQPSLKQIFKKFYIGTALNNSQVSGGDQESIMLVEKQFNSITPENLLKWEKVHPEPNQYHFEPVDSFVNFGEKNKMFIVGHTLIWHSQTPGWVFEDEAGNPLTRESLLERMKEHIFAVVGRYKGRIQGWDVVNEAVEDDGQMRNSKWMQIIGPDYIQKAFEWAHEADPAAELYYNDFNMWHKGKIKSVAQLVHNLKSNGVKIDGIGLQGHWGMDYPPLNELDLCLKAYSALGVKLMITELDINILPQLKKNTGAEITTNYEYLKELNPFSEGLPDSMQVKLANRYADYFRLFNKYSDVISRVTFWGVHDGVSWHNNWPIVGRTAHSLLFDRNYQPKPAFYEVIKTVGEREHN